MCERRAVFLNPSFKPSLNSSLNPSLKPSFDPSLNPSLNPSFKPSFKPSVNPIRSVTASLSQTAADMVVSRWVDISTSPITVDELSKALEFYSPQLEEHQALSLLRNLQRDREVLADLS